MMAKGGYLVHCMKWGCRNNRRKSPGWGILPGLDNSSIFSHTKTGKYQSGPGGNVECNGHRKERICIVMSEVNRRPSYPTALIIFDVLTDSPKCHPSK